MKRLILFLNLILLSSASIGQTYYGTVLRVIDGDTFVLQTKEGSIKVRMNGIDAPEKDQPYGQKSLDFLAKYEGREALVEQQGIDKYGRTLGIIYISNININLLLVKEGFAWHYKQYSTDQSLADAETQAKEASLGLWSDSDPIAPWSWRKGDRGTKTTVSEEKNNENQVLVCNGSNSYAYHKYVCRGLARCRSGVVKMTKDEAERNGRTPCRNCYR